MSENKGMPDGASAILAFGDDQLKALGEMTILFASLEDAITKYAKALLAAFPQLVEIHKGAPAQGRPVDDLMFDGKQKLLKKLVRKLAQEHDVDATPLINALGESKKASQDRNHAIHGWLDWDCECGNVVFRNKKGQGLPADISEIRRLKTDLLRAFEKIVVCYDEFSKCISHTEIEPG